MIEIYKKFNRESFHINIRKKTMKMNKIINKYIIIN